MSTLIGKIEPGDVIGRCRVIRELGRGGVGTVYLATHQTLQIEVALKVLSPALSMDNPALAERFIREAQLAARIRHPNVIAVMDAAHDEATGLYFIVLEYVAGGALSWHLRHGPLPETKAFSIITGIAHALVLAEESRVVHRDIKPDNIMLDLRGTPKLADLGLAKHSFDSRISLTLGGSYMGTPAYMSPEQARDAKVADTRDDIYSLGATFYECLTGEPPFQGETPYNIMSELLTKPSPVPSASRPEVSRCADMICRKMMAKTRQLRYADAQALLHDLQIFQLHGDAGFDRLEASSFAYEANVARQQALDYGVATSADGVFVPETMDELEEPEPISHALPPPAERFKPSRPVPANDGAYRAALILLVLVTAVTLLLVWLGPQRHSTYVRQLFARLTGTTVVQPATPAVVLPAANPPSAAVKPPVKEHHVHHTEAQPLVTTTNEAPPIRAVTTLPVALPVNPDELTNGAPVTGTNGDLPPGVTPVLPVVSATAFEARSIAEANLGNTMTDPTGQAELVKIVGKRDKSSPDVSPTTWTFYFYDPSVPTTNARVVTVTDGKVVKSGGVLVDRDHLLPYVFSYGTKDILPNDRLATDSSNALATAETRLPPGIAASSAQMELTQKDSVPMWRVTLWARDAKGTEQELGTVSILAENNVVSAAPLKFDRILPHQEP